VLIIGVPLGLYILDFRGSPLLLIGLFLLGATYSFAGFCLPKRRYAVKWWAPLPCLAGIVLAVLEPSGHPILIAINLALIAFVLGTWNWQEDTNSRLDQVQKSRIILVAIVVGSVVLLGIFLSMFALSNYSNYG
jgi:lysylphosphatidylglycerol synthetase-like protein (DUF2156 family)